MRNHLPQLKAGAVRVDTVVVHHDADADTMALYQDPDGRLTLLLDSFRDGAWDSVLLRPESVDALRKRLNKAHRERERR